ncbi:response regulator transcription factor [Oryzobacter sp. R7]|uniref:response regulator transcription factor n=1 Tax=Oryzobacter faecalis TaxID=3388656 RepID=UPI00398C9C77
MEPSRLAREALRLAHEAADGAGVVPEALGLLDRAVGADVLNSSLSLDLGGDARTEVTMVHAPPLTPREDEEWRRLLPTHPFAASVVTGGRRTARLTDHMGLRDLEDLEVYQTLLEPRGSRYQLAAVLAADDSSVSILSLWRTDEDFSADEVAAVELVRRALAAALDYRAVVDELARMAGPTGAEDVLTPRQRQVCALVARGLTNSQVAARTGVTERTVRKHLEDVFARTGCTSRTAVALWWREHGGDRRGTPRA